MPSVPEHFDVPEAVYLPDGPGRYETTALAAGPWDENGQHAGASSALLAHCMERHELGDIAPSEVLMARFTVDLLRPAPIAPLAVEVRTRRAGRRAHWLEGSLSAGGREVARATGLRLPAAPLELPAGAEGADAPLPEPESVPVFEPDGPGPEWLMFWHAFETRSVEGRHGEPGPCTEWFRLRFPLVAGVPNTPLVHVMAAADFTLGIGSSVDYSRFAAPNADLTVHLRRLPEDDWIGLEADSRLEARGSGLAEAALHDRRGVIGTALQSMVVSPRV